MGGRRRGAIAPRSGDAACGSIRGLTKFVADIRTCGTREREERRVRAELAKVKSQLAAGVTTGYNRRKCVWKVVYMAILGYPPTVGHVEALTLIASPVPIEKCSGYLAASLLFGGQPAGAAILEMCINHVKLDLNLPNQCGAAAVEWALAFLANCPVTPGIAGALFADVERIAFLPGGGHPSPGVRLRAYLALLRLIKLRTAPVCLSWVGKIANALRAENDVGSLSALCALAAGAIAVHVADATDGGTTAAGAASGAAPASSIYRQWLPVVNPALDLLAKITKEKGVSNGWDSAAATYAGVPAPWLQIRLLQLLQNFPPSVLAKQQLQRVAAFCAAAVHRAPSVPASAPATPGGTAIVKKTRTEQERASQCHVEHAVYFAVCDLLGAYGTALPPAPRRDAALQLSALLGPSLGDSNIRCRRLDALSKLTLEMDVVRQLQKQLPALISQLRDNDDEAIQKKSVALLFAICDSSVWRTVVDALLAALKTQAPPASFWQPAVPPSSSVRDALVSAIATLAEKHSETVEDFCEIVFQLLDVAPEAAAKSGAWQRLTARLAAPAGASARLAAARLAADSLADRFCGGGTLALSAYIVGEYADAIALEVPPEKQLALVTAHFPTADAEVRPMLLTAAAKLAKFFPPLAPAVIAWLDEWTMAVDVEVQQRAQEYIGMLTLLRETAAGGLGAMLRPVPPMGTRLKDLDLLATSPEEGRTKDSPSLAAAAAAATTTTTGGAASPEGSSSDSSTDDGERPPFNLLPGPGAAASFDRPLLASLNAAREQALFFPSDPRAAPGLELRLRTQLHPPTLRVLVQVRNRSAVPVRLHQATVAAASAHVPLAVRAGPLSAGGGPVALLPEQTHAHALEVEARAPGPGPPPPAPAPPAFPLTYTVVFEAPVGVPPGAPAGAGPLAGVPLQVAAPLPVSLASCCVPAHVSVDTFKRYWAAVPAPPAATSGRLRNYTADVRAVLAAGANLFVQEIDGDLCGSGTIKLAERPVAVLVRVTPGRKNGYAMVRVGASDPAVQPWIAAVLATTLLEHREPQL